MSGIELEKIKGLLREFTLERKCRLHVILIGGLAVQYYGIQDRTTIDIDAEVRGDIEGLFNYLKTKNIPGDISEDISRWSVISMPPGYRDRITTIYKDDFLEICVLHPLDFIISKLRRFSEEDIDDAQFVARKFNVSVEDIKRSSEDTIKHSIIDTALFIFRKNVEIFISKLS